MAVVTIPSGVLDYIRSQPFGMKNFDLEFSSELTGGSQARLLAPPRWTCSLVAEEDLAPDVAALWRAFILSLEGKVNQLAVYDLLNTAPRGTMRGTPVLNAGVAVGDRTIAINAGVGEASTTLLKGDWIGLGSGSTRQLFTVTADATANGSGVFSSVSVYPPARFAQTNGTAVTWDKPTCLMRRTTDETSWTASGYFTGNFSLDLQESWE